MNTDALKKVALSIRALSMDGVQKANSGHPGLPMGCADSTALLFCEFLNHAPQHPDWPNRDRFVLSAGHGSMLLYSLLHLSGYALDYEELKKFRQLGSKTPGHPEFGMTPGVETTTGPLGQGIANAVGMAIAAKMQAQRFNTSNTKLLDPTIWVLAGDGCMMEGVSSEAASLAGHLGLNNLVVLYDSNKITIEGSTDLAFTEDTKKRFEAYGWHVMECGAYDYTAMAECFLQAKKEQNKPIFILLRSVIGYGSPNKAGSHDVHGSPLGKEEVLATRRSLGIPEDKDFHIDPGAQSFLQEKQSTWETNYASWQKVFSQWAKDNPELKKEWDSGLSDSVLLEQLAMPDFSVGKKMATRKASGMVINAIAKLYKHFTGGSADLAPSNNTFMNGIEEFSKTNRSGRNLHFGVREHAMGAVCNGMILFGGLRVYCATFLVFSDYMRPPLRLASLMGIPLVSVFTHDSIFVGEDGPTHQPIEHIASLRAIPGMLVLRPGDAQETFAAWKIALKQKHKPSCILLTRQDLEIYPKADPQWQNTIEKGAYIVQAVEGKPDAVIVATGSEVTLALQAAKASGKKVQVVSMLSRETFLQQEASFHAQILPMNTRCIVCEAGISMGWERIASSMDSLLCINRFGESGPGEKVAEHLGLSVERLVQLILR